VSNQVTLEQLEEQAIQLPLPEQLKLIAYLSERLSVATPSAPATEREESSRQQREREADEILALCDAAAELWQGEFEAEKEIRQLRQERDERIWQSKS
jgi:phosphoribosylanthranilate isomerase